MEIDETERAVGRFSLHEGVRFCWHVNDLIDSWFVEIFLSHTLLIFALHPVLMLRNTPIWKEAGDLYLAQN